MTAARDPATRAILRTSSAQRITLSAPLGTLPFLKPGSTEELQ